jgi:hypothetical protein
MDRIYALEKSGAGKWIYGFSFSFYKSVMLQTYNDEGDMIQKTYSTM